MEPYNSAQYESVDSIINSMLRREGDVAGLKKLQYKDFANDVFEELNLTSIKMSTRLLLTVDKRLGVAHLPSSVYALSSLSFISKDHKIEPLLLNRNLTDDIVDVGLAHDCGCECGCTSKSCCSVNNYELISEEVTLLVPQGGGATETYTKTSRKYIKPDGSFYLEVTEPVIQYDGDGIAVSIEIDTRETFICKLQVKECGCVEDCDENCKILKEHCSALDFEYERGSCHPSYFEHCQKGNYNISVDGKRIVLPPGFDYDKILARCYVHLPTKELLIPRLAKKAFMAGMRFEIADWSKNESERVIARLRRNYSLAVTQLGSALGRCMLTDFYAYVLGIRN